MPRNLQIAVIGAGTVAQAVHLPVLRRRWDRFTVSALVDISDRRRTESSEVFGVAEEQRYASTEALLAAVRAKQVQVDAAVLASDGLHVEDVLVLIRRGIPVLAEPPLGFSEAEMRRVADFERMTGRQLVMMAHPQQYDEALERIADLVPPRDLRMLDYETVMPATQPLYGHAHVTASAYDLPSEVRAARRSALQKAVEAGSGEGATQRDRDLFVKGLLTGVAHQAAAVRRLYGPITRVVAVRHWPKSVVPGSVEVLAEVGERGPVRLVWHYLPFAPEHTERIGVLSARKRVDCELQAASFHDRRSSVLLREKTGGAIVRTRTEASLGQAEAMWMAFHAFVTSGQKPVSGIAEAIEDTLLMREILALLVAADGRTIDPEPEPEVEPEVVASEPEAEPDVVASEPEVESEPVADGVAAEPEAEPEPVADGVAAEPEVESEPVADGVAAEPEVESEPVADGVAAEPEVESEPQPEPDVVASELEPEPAVPDAPSQADADGDRKVRPLTAAEIADQAARDVLADSPHDAAQERHETATEDPTEADEPHEDLAERPRDRAESSSEDPAPEEADASAAPRAPQPEPQEPAAPAPYGRRAARGVAAEGARRVSSTHDPAAAVDEDDAWG